MGDDTRDKVIALEAEVKHFKDQLDKIELQVEQMHSLLMQAKGARWAILSVVAIGGFVAGKFGAIFPFLTGGR